MRILMTFVALLFCVSCSSEKSDEGGVAEATKSAEMTMPGIKGVRYVGVTVSDIDEMLTFYNQGVEYEVVKRYTVEASEFASPLLSETTGPVDIALIRLPNVYLQLIDFDPDVKEAAKMRLVSGPGYTHICFISPESNSAYTKFQAAGMEMVSRGDEPVDLGGYGMRYAYGLDPDGTMIEMEVATKPRRPDSFWVGHIANVSHDIERMADFYTDILGYGPRRTAELSDNPRADEIANIDNVAIRAAWFSTGNLDLEFWQYTNPVTQPHAQKQKLDRIGYNSIAFEVTDLDSEVDRLRSLGVDMIGSIVSQNGWELAYFYDPDGNVFSLQQNVSAEPGQSIDEMIWMTAGPA